MRWRPGPDTAIALTALVVAAAGTSWAVTQSASPQVLAACLPPPGTGSGQLTITSSTCPPGDTTEATWNQQGVTGSQGPTGLQGLEGPPGKAGAPGQNAPTPETGVLHQVFRSWFRIQLAFTSPGTYQVDGSVTEHVNTAGWPHYKFHPNRHPVLGISCDLEAGPSSPVTRLDLETQSFVWSGAPLSHYFASVYDGPAGAGGVLSVPSVPHVAWFRCYTGVVKLGSPDYVPKYLPLPGVAFVNPTITATLSTTPHVTISKVVGPIIAPTPSPGPLSRH